jgi:hypothetical protein
MTIGERLGSTVATARTFFTAFAGPCLWIGISAAVIGAGISGYASFKVTRAFYQRAALKAENKLAQLDVALANERAENLRLAGQLSAEVLENRNAEKARVDAVAASLDDLGRRVRLCAQKSDVRVTVSPSGAIATVPDGQLRDLADAVRDFAIACAVQRDRDAVDHNALVEWLERMAKRKDE